jgi:hypothetical protein
MAIWSILRLFGICSLLHILRLFGKFFTVFGMLCKEKTGNPGSEPGLCDFILWQMNHLTSMDVLLKGLLD